MECCLSLALRLAWLAGLLVPASASLAGVSVVAPVLNVSGDDFPSLVVHQPAVDDTGRPAVLLCAQIRSKRIDELDPLWKQAVDRIHLDCEDLTAESAGIDMVVTVITAYLKPGTVQFAGIPVAEVRMMDSELWSDHQYLLDRPYAQIRTTLHDFLAARCHASHDNPAQIMQSDCAFNEDGQGLYMDANQLGGIWVHAEQDNPQRTVYAEAWSD